MDDLTRARYRLVLLELEELAPELASIVLEHPSAGPVIREALGQRRLWNCPLCNAFVCSAAPPDGWLIVTPFTRVAACSACRPHLKAVS